MAVAPWLPVSKPSLRKVLLGAGALAIASCAVMGLRASSYGVDHRVSGTGVAPELEAEEREAVAEALAQAIRIATISESSQRDEARFAELWSWAKGRFPALHAKLEFVEGPGSARLAKWSGTSEEEPLLLLAHADVVPVDGDELAWTHPPFDGVRDGGVIYGRGAIDDKGSMVALLQALEGLARADFQPRRTIWLAFGSDEETGGTDASAMAEILKAREVRPGLVLDEGGVVLAGTMPGIEAPIAFVGVAEKGYATFELYVKGAGGHASSPPRQNAIGILAVALAKIDAHPMPAQLSQGSRQMLEALGKAMPVAVRLVVANLELFEPLLIKALDGGDKTRAVVRTTFASTILEAGSAENVLPVEARAAINVRLHPNDTLEEVQAHLRRVISDERVEISVRGSAREASPDSRIEGPGWEALMSAIGASFPDAIPAPYVVIAGTDARHYRAISDAVYRFAPYYLTSQELSTVHNTDEQISEDKLARAVAFYRQLVRSYAG